MQPQPSHSELDTVKYGKLSRSVGEAKNVSVYFLHVTYNYSKHLEKLMAHSLSLSYYQVTVLITDGHILF